MSSTREQRWKIKKKIEDKWKDRDRDKNKKKKRKQLWLLKAERNDVCELKFIINLFII